MLPSARWRVEQRDESKERDGRVRGGQGSERSSGQAGYRLGRLWAAADLRRVPLRTIIAAILAVAFFFLAGKLIYRLRDVLLLIVVAGFLALILNPVVLVIQKHVVKRRGYAVSIVGVLALLVFVGLLVAFGYPLAGAITHLADNLPTYVSNAEHGKGWLGRLVQHYHVQQWVQQNSAKLVTFGQNLSKPALAVGKGAATLLIELLTIFILVLMLLLEGPKLRRGVLSLFSPRQAEEAQAIASEVPFPLLWALWVALVDFLPMIGGALAGIPVVIFAAFHSLTAGIVTLVVFLVYTQLENHILNPVIMSKTVRISPLLVLVSVLVAASLGDWIGGLFGGFVAALLAIPAAGALQVITREAWRLTAPPPADEAEEQAMVTAAGEAATDAGEFAEEGEAADESGPSGATDAGSADKDGGQPAEDSVSVEITVPSGRDVRGRDIS
jgi:predicted PurR-regulated permease PerM